MANAKEIKMRRKAVQNTRKITRTMEMVSTARFKKAFDRAVATRPYSEKLTGMLQVLAPVCEGMSHPLLERRSNPKRASILVVTSNRGLCGGFNANVLKQASNTIDAWKEKGVEIDLHVSGKRGIAYFRYLGIEMSGQHHEFSDKPTYEAVTEVVDGLMAAYEKGETDAVALAYTQFHSVARQSAAVDQVLPIDAIAATEGEGEGDKAAQKGDVLFDPDPESILQELLPLYVRTSFFSAFLDANVSEHIARMVAMKAATDASEQMIKDLTRAYNRARQAQITNEIAEIVGGAAALD